MNFNRRNFIKRTGLAGTGLFFLPYFLKARDSQGEMFFKISLAEWSLHRMLRSGDLTNLKFPEYALRNFDIHAVEYVSTFFKNTQKEYLAELKNRTTELGVRNVLIMVDAEGNLGELNKKERMKSVENHFRWVDSAKYLGCHSIRVNARGKGSPDEVADAAVKGLSDLAKYAAGQKINVIVENHGGISSNGQWLSDVIRRVGMDNCGTLPDFGNFRISKNEEYDRYKGVKELMPFAKGVSAKSHDFNEAGEEIHTDFYKMLKIVKDAGYMSFIGIEYEGSGLSEVEGIKATKRLLEKVGKELS